MRNSLISLLLLLFLCFIASCDYRKYEEGPFLSVYDTETRLTNTWKWTLVLENGTPLTGNYTDSTITFGADNLVQVCSTEGNCREGNWNLASKRSRLQLIFGRNTQIFQIRMLRRDELWLMSEDSLAIEWELKPLME